MVVIFHISDLHVNGEFYSEKLANILYKHTKVRKPDIIIVTGDITDYGYVHEYEKAIFYLSSLETEKLIVVPGNHDSRNLGYIVFEKIFGTRYPFYIENNLCIQGIDSTEPDIDDGHIGRLTYYIVEENLKKCNGLKIVALHHHLVPVPWTGRERNIPVDAGDFLYLLLKLGVNIVLSGHKHVPWMWNVNNMIILHSGTTTTYRLKAGIHPSYNVLELNDKELLIKRVFIDQEKEVTIIRRSVTEIYSKQLNNSITYMNIGLEHDNINDILKILSEKLI